MNKYDKLSKLVNEDIKMVEDVIEKMTHEQAMTAIKKLWELHQPRIIVDKWGTAVNCIECCDVYNERISWPCHDIEAIVGEEL